MTLPSTVHTLLLAGLVLGAGCSDDKPQGPDDGEEIDASTDDSTSIKDAGTSTSDASARDANTPSSDASTTPSRDASTTTPSTDAGSSTPSADAGSTTTDAGTGSSKACGSAPTVESFGLAFFEAKCNACHSGIDRPIFETKAIILDYKDEIQRRVHLPAGEKQRMPPTGLSPAELTQVTQFLDCLK